jgi:putative hemolysin
MFESLKNAPDLTSIRIGDIYLILTKDPKAVLEAQKLRHQVFFQEYLGKTEFDYDAVDADEFDEHCDHLLVVDEKGNNGKPLVAGTYRFLRRDANKPVTKFYSETEYDISRLKNVPNPIMELGRSCTHKNYRDGGVIQLLWKGIGAYVHNFNIAYMFGCASFPGTDPMEHQLGLSYLYHYHLAPEDVRTFALPHVKGEFKLLDKDAFDKKAGFASLPPLIKGYIRVGATIGDGCVIDNLCKTTDVSIIVDSSRIARRYQEHFVK